MSIRVRSPRREPPVREEDGSTARTATRRPCCSMACRPYASRNVLFPAPGGPVIARLVQDSFSKDSERERERALRAKQRVNDVPSLNAGFESL